jgi:hypothetical protein
MAEIKETKVAENFNDSHDVINRFYKLPKEEQNEFELAKVKIALGVLQLYENHRRQDRETVSFKMAVGNRIFKTEEDKIEWFKANMPEIKKFMPVPKLEVGKTE